MRKLLFLTPLILLLLTVSDLEEQLFPDNAGENIDPDEELVPVRRSSCLASKTPSYLLSFFQTGPLKKFSRLCIAIIFRHLSELIMRNFFKFLNRLQKKLLLKGSTVPVPPMHLFQRGEVQRDLITSPTSARRRSRDDSPPKHPSLHF